MLLSQAQESPSGMGKGGAGQPCPRTGSLELPVVPACLLGFFSILSLL